MPLAAFNYHNEPWRTFRTTRSERRLDFRVVGQTRFSMQRGYYRELGGVVISHTHSRRSVRIVIRRPNTRSAP